MTADPTFIAYGERVKAFDANTGEPLPGDFPRSEAAQRELDEQRERTHDYRVTVPTDDPFTDRVLVVEGDGWIKIPLALAKGTDGAIDAQGLELGILAGFILRQHELLGYSPTLRKLQELSGRGRERVLSGLRSLSAMGVIQMRKVKFQTADGEGWKWRFVIPKGSPLEKCRTGVKDAGRPWVMLPEGVARFQSTVPAALALVFEEMRRQDGAVVGTPTMFARMMGCSRSTAKRALKKLGAVPVAKSADGSKVYHYRQHVRVAGVKGSMKVRGVWLAYDKMQDRERLEELDVLIRAKGTNMGDTPERVAAAGGTVATLVRALEEEHLASALRDPQLRPRIRRMLSYRLRKRYHRIPRALQPKVREATRSIFQQAAASGCSECHDVPGNWVELPDGTWGACPSCRPRAAAPPG